MIVGQHIDKMLIQADSLVLCGIGKRAVQALGKPQRHASIKSSCSTGGGNDLPSSANITVVVSMVSIARS